MKKVIRFMSVITLSATMLLCSNATSAKALDRFMMDMDNTHTVTLNLDSSKLPNDGVSYIDVYTNATYINQIGLTRRSKIYSEDSTDRNSMPTNNLFSEGASIVIYSTAAPNVGYGNVGYSPVITKLTVNGVDFTEYIPATFLGEQSCTLICPDFDITIDIEYEMVYYYYDIRETFDHSSDSYKMLVNGNGMDVLGKVADLSKELPVPSQSVENIFSDIMEQQPEDITTDVIEEQEQTPSEDIIEEQPSEDIIEEQPVEDTTIEDITEEQPVEDTINDTTEQEQPEQTQSEDITEEQPVEDTTEQEPTAPVTNTSDTNNVLPIIVLLAASIINIKKIRE